MLNFSPMPRHKVTEWSGLEGTFKDHLVLTPYCGQGHLSLDQVLKAPSNLALKISSDGGACTASRYLMLVAAARENLPLCNDSFRNRAA